MKIRQSVAAPKQSGYALVCRHIFQRHGHSLFFGYFDEKIFKIGFNVLAVGVKHIAAGNHVDVNEKHGVFRVKSLRGIKIRAYHTRFLRAESHYLNIEGQRSAGKLAGDIYEGGDASSVVEGTVRRSVNVVVVMSADYHRPRSHLRCGYAPRNILRAVHSVIKRRLFYVGKSLLDKPLGNIIGCGLFLLRKRLSLGVRLYEIFKYKINFVVLSVKDRGLRRRHALIADGYEYKNRHASDNNKCQNPFHHNASKSTDTSFSPK